MDTQAALIVLSQALKLEQEGRAFYLQAADETLDEQGQRMFTSLAEDEARHADMVLRQLHALEGGGAYVLLPNLDVRPIDLDARLFPPARKDVEAKIGMNPSVLDALHVALENEIKSYDLYRNAAKGADGNGRQMYEWLASAEMTHFDLLMSNYESLVASAGWV
ncbi:MAG: ferritin-like domain-containing protein [Anaerolineae bacterium]